MLRLASVHPSDHTHAHFFSYYFTTRTFV